MPKKNLTGQRFGKLVVISEAEPYYPPNSNKRHRRWLCQCDCGKTSIAFQGGLLNGETKSCSCLRRENVGRKKNIHPCSHRLHSIWSGIKDRCFNPNSPEYKNYGGRGITMCDEWSNNIDGYDNFYEWAVRHGYEENLTIDRIDVNGIYEPSNCRWATFKEQQNNRTDNVYVIFNDKKQTIAQWAEELKINENTIRARLRHGWTIEEAFSNKQRIGYRTAKKYEYGGLVMSMAEWADYLGVSKATLESRRCKGWPIEKIFETPVNNNIARRKKNEPTNS